MYEDELRVKILKALADEMRLKIIRVLYTAHREMACGEISENIGVPNSTISYHLKTLREAQLTNTRKESQHRFIELKIETFDKYMPGFLDALLD